MIKRVGLPLIIIVAAIFIVVLLIVTSPDTTVSERSEKKWLVNAVTANYTSLAPEITLYGRVETPRNATLTAALEADVEAVHALEGQRISQGELLIALDDIDARLVQQQRQADVAEIQALITIEQQRFERDKALLNNQQQLVSLANNAVQRAKKLGQSKLTSQATQDETVSAYQQQILSLKQLQHDIDEHPSRLAQLEAQLQRATALTEQSDVSLSRTQIRSPYNGRIAKLNVAVGDRVRAGDELISVYDTDQLEVRAQIPGRYLSEVNQRLQQNETMLATALVNGQKIELVLNRLSGRVQQDSGGVEGLFRLRHSDLQLPLGTFVELQLVLKTQQQVVEIPFNALYGLDRIYLIEAGYLRSVQITRVGEIQHDDGRHSVLIRGEALTQGVSIVATQLPNAITGLPVEIAP